MKRKIITEKEVLHQESREINFSDANDIAYAIKVIRDLMDTLSISKNGIGLAAPQIGEQVQIFVYQRNSQNIEYVINPSFTSKNNKITISVEGCLSCPDNGTIKIPRYKTIYAEGYDIGGKLIKKTLTGIAAIIFQHELDHLKGKLITDYI